MAVEAQLFPQCGATVQFAEMQTEVVCSYCGATVDKTLVQAIQRVNNVGELSAENQAKVNQLILDGRRKDALYFIQQHTGLGEASANAAIDKKINDWVGADDHTHGHVISNREFLVVAGIIAIDVLGIVALIYVADESKSIILECGLFWVIFTHIYVVAALPWVKARLSVMSGQPGAAVLQKAVALQTIGGLGFSWKPTDTKTRLLINISPPGEQSRVIEISMVLPRETADRLRPGNKLEVITNGPNFVYITDPIKVLA